MRPQHLQATREACIKANPEIATRQMDYTNEKGGTDWVQDCTIRLADVLLAMEKSGIGVRPNGMFVKIGGFHQKNVNYTVGWNLRKDDLTEQSDATIKFLSDILKGI